LRSASAAFCRTTCAWRSPEYSCTATPWWRGLGGRAITRKSLTKLLHDAQRDVLEPLTFLDLDWNAVNRVLERERQVRRSGPIAETLLRDLGVVASRIA
jgi:pyruvate ferredoxin oxidoreductase alpha subunit